MGKALVWDASGEHYYTTGVDKVAAYPQETDGYGIGEAWNGVMSVNESPEGADKEALWANNNKYLNLISKEEWKGGVSAYTCPKIIEDLDGTTELLEGVRIGQQARGAFGMTWRTKIGNDIVGTKLGYEIHIAYGLSISPTDKDYESESDDPNARELQWDLDSVPVTFTYDGQEYTTSTIVIDSRNFTGEKEANLKALEEVLWGTDSTEPTLPLPDKVLSILKTGQK